LDIWLPVTVLAHVLKKLVQLRNDFAAVPGRNECMVNCSVIDFSGLDSRLHVVLPVPVSGSNQEKMVE
jgi:hypothetical protein